MGKSTRIKCKICGVTSPETAHFAAKSGVSYIGLHFDETSPNTVSGAQAIEITLAAKEGGAIPVALFSSHAGKEMLQICQDLNLDTLQLAGLTSQKEHPILPSSYTRIYPISVDQTGAYKEPPLKTLNIKRDYLLYHMPSPNTKLIPIPKYHFALSGSFSVNQIATLAPSIADLRLDTTQNHDTILRFLDDLQI